MTVNQGLGKPGKYEAGTSSGQAGNFMDVLSRRRTKAHKDSRPQVLCCGELFRYEGHRYGATVEGTHVRRYSPHFLCYGRIAIGIVRLYQMVMGYELIDCFAL